VGSRLASPSSRARLINSHAAAAHCAPRAAKTLFRPAGAISFAALGECGCTIDRDAAIQSAQTRKGFDRAKGIHLHSWLAFFSAQIFHTFCTTIAQSTFPDNLAIFQGL